MFPIKRFAVAATLAAAVATAAYAKVPVVGGAAMPPTNNIVQNAVHSKIHTTLVAAVKAAGLVETLSGPGPFTVFAPTNAAFAKLPKAAVADLLKPENKEKLAAVLTYHVVAGKLSAQDIAEMIKQGGGKAELTTVNGGKLVAQMKGGVIYLNDAKGDTATVTQGNVFQSNGVIHVINTVMLPG